MKLPSTISFHLNGAEDYPSAFSLPGFVPRDEEVDIHVRIENLRRFFLLDYAGFHRDALLSLLTALESVVVWNNLKKWGTENQVLERHPFRQLSDPYPLRFLMHEGVIDRIAYPTLRKGPGLERVMRWLEDDWRMHETYRWEAHSGLLR